LPALETRATWWPSDATRDQGRGGDFSLMSAGISVRVPLGMLDVGAGLELARMTATGVGFDRVQDATDLVPAITVEPGVSVPIAERLAFRTAVQLRIPLVRPRFTFEQGGDNVLVYQPAVIGGVLWVGADARF
jgi:hypothetical protein